MAAPNIVSVVTITGKSGVLALTTSAVSIASNAAASGKVFKINSLIISNVDGTVSADVTASYYSAAALGGTPYRLGLTITIPAKTSLVLIDKNASFYLEEDKSIGLTASANGDLEAVISYEEIS